jgi:pyruvate/2-oxoglutarate/acetoin dehydrogenase E1 component
MTYKDTLAQAMQKLAEDPKAVFIGYGVRYGGMAAGTLKQIPECQLIETPVAENLMVAIGIGMALQGYKPVIFIERFDFILNALDAIVNHLDKIAVMSRGEFKPTLILRVVVGNRQSHSLPERRTLRIFRMPLRRWYHFRW